MSNKHIFEDSSSITHIDYHEDKDTLEICFASGSTYHYPNVPKDMYEALKKAESPGGFFAKQMRNRFKGVKV